MRTVCSFFTARSECNYHPRDNTLVDVRAGSGFLWFRLLSLACPQTRIKLSAVSRLHPLFSIASYTSNRSVNTSPFTPATAACLLVDAAGQVLCCLYAGWLLLLQVLSQELVPTQRHLWEHGYESAMGSMLEVRSTLDFIAVVLDYRRTNILQGHHGMHDVWHAQQTISLFKSMLVDDSQVREKRRSTPPDLILPTLPRWSRGVLAS